MTEAWMRRGSERQEFIERLKMLIIDDEEESHNRLSVQIPLLILLVQHLAVTEKADLLDIVPVPKRTRDLFFTLILPELTSFARTPEEAAALLAELFLWEANSIANAFKSPLQTQEIMEPEKVFGGHQAMDDVD